MNAVRYQVLRVVLGITLTVLVSMESSMWWLAAIPWAVVCMFGIIATIPIVALIGFGAGAAQADWMSDGFIIGLVIVTPTTLSLIASALLNWKMARQAAGPESKLAEAAPSDSDKPSI